MLRRNKTRLNPLSKKRRIEKQDYKKAYQEQDKKTMEEEGLIVCRSCGRTLVGPSGQGIHLWGHSHNMPVKHYPALEADPLNFSPRCQNWLGKKGCHEKLDEPDFREIAAFIDLHDIMAYRLKKDKNAYNQFVSGLNAVGLNPGYDYANRD